jgi:hypothetical protein
VLSVGEVLDAGARDVADAVERIIFAAAVAADVLLDPGAGPRRAAVPSLSMWDAWRTATAS